MVRLKTILDTIVTKLGTINNKLVRRSPASGGTDLSMVNTGDMYTWNNKASTSVATTSANGLMSADDKTKLNAIGTKYPNTTGYGSFSKSIPSSTDATYMGSFTLPSLGTWIIHIFCDYPASANGYRYVCFGESATSSERRAEYGSASVPGAASVRGRAQFTYIADISTTANLTFYLWTAQNSGSAMNGRIYYRAVKILNH